MWRQWVPDGSGAAAGSSCGDAGAWSEMPRSPGHAFYDRLQAELSRRGSTASSRASARPTTRARGAGPSLPPGRYFRMLLVGYFEGIDSERGLEWRCADSLSLREFLRSASASRCRTLIRSAAQPGSGRTRAPAAAELHDQVLHLGPAAPGRSTALPPPGDHDGPDDSGHVFRWRCANRGLSPSSAAARDSTSPCPTTPPSAAGPRRWRCRGARRGREPVHLLWTATACGSVVPGVAGGRSTAADGAGRGEVAPGHRRRHRPHQSRRCSPTRRQ
jgi:hypothetical protein